jgi:hypothetical protein
MGLKMIVETVGHYENTVKGKYISSGNGDGIKNLMLKPVPRARHFLWAKRLYESLKYS